MKSVVGLLLIVAQCCLFLSFAQAEPQRYKDWSKQCAPLPTGKRACHIFHTVINKQNGEALLRAEVGAIPGKKQVLLLFTVPLGVALKPGLKFQVDSSKAKRLDYDVCARDGCRAAKVMNAHLVRAMKRGARGKVIIMMLDGKVVALPLSLSGFTKAINSLDLF